MLSGTDIHTCMHIHTNIHATHTHAHTHINFSFSRDLAYLNNVLS